METVRNKTPESKHPFDMENMNTVTFISCLGLSAPQAWIFWINSIASSGDQRIAWQIVYGMLSLVLVASAILAIKRPKIPRVLASKGVSCAVGTAGSVLLIASCVANNSAITAFALFVCALGLALSYIQWGVFYAKINLRNAILFLFSSGIAAAAIKAFAFFAPWPVEAVVCSALPAISSALNAKAERYRPNPMSARIFFNRQNITGLWKAALAVATFSAASAVLLAIAPPPKETASMFFLIGRLTEALLCAGVLVLLFPLGKTFDFPRLWKAILVLVATGILACIAFPQSVIQSVFSSASINFIVLFVWLTLSDIARHSTMSPVVVFGIGWSCYTLPFFLGSEACIALDESISDPVRLSFVLYAVALVAAFCLERRDRDIALIFSDLAERRAEPSDFADIDNRCAAVAKSYSLTERELEVMQHLCKGRSKAYIAEALFVTENTIKGHTKRIYSKLDVHSRKELQQLVDTN